VFRYRLHSPDGDDLGEATYAQMIKLGERSSSAGQRFGVLDVVRFERTSRRSWGFCRSRRRKKARRLAERHFAASCEAALYPHPARSDAADDQPAALVAVPDMSRSPPVAREKTEAVGAASGQHRSVGFKKATA
jgi:hypothetical protein